jgi:hypothetical protein
MVKLRTHRNRTTRFAAAGTAVATFAAALVASLGALVATSVAPAAATGSNGQTTYEMDCVGTSLAAGQTAPFIMGLNVTPSVTGDQPAGTPFGVSGTASETLIGPIIAGAYQQINLALTGGLTASVSGLTVGSTDGNGTGSFTYVQPATGFGNQAAPGRQVAGVNWTAGSTTLLGNFQATDVGTATNPMFVAGPAGTIDPNSTVVSVVPGVSATISTPTLAAPAAASNVGLGQSLTFADPAFNTGNVFTTTSTNGGPPANIGVTSMASTTLTTAGGGIVVPFGGLPGTSTGAADPRCLETGYTAAGSPGPVQFGDTTPADPVITFPQYQAAGITSLVLASGGFITQPQTAQAITPPAAANVTAPPALQCAITTTSLPDAQQNVAYSSTLASANCTAPLTWSATGLPAGLSINASTGEISGTPTVSGDSSVMVTLTAANGTPTATLALHVAANVAPSAADASATIDRNVSNTATLTLPATDTDGTPVTSCSAGTPSDPRLMVSVGSPTATGCPATLTDTGGASQPPLGPVTFTFTATDGFLTSNTATVTVTIVPKPHVAVATTSLPDAPEGVPYSQTLAATGGTSPYTWSADPATLPAGLSVSGAGVISGTPAAGSAGSYNVAVTVTDSDSPAETATASIPLTVTPPPSNDAALDVIVNGPLSSTKTSKALVAKVTNTGTTTFQVCDTDISWAVPTGSVSMPAACATLGPGASKRFKATWNYDAGLTSGQVVDITGTVTVAGDTNTTNNSNTETRTVK